VTVVDLASERRFARLAAVVTPRGLHGVLAVPVVVAGRPVGALSVYATEWCPWSGIDVAALGAYAGWSPSWWQPAWRWRPGTTRWPS
jgi:GAF domain-containing protein